jgi:hypothetical protein
MVASAGAKLGKVSDEFYRFYPFEMLETPFVLVAKGKFSAMRYADKQSVHLIDQACFR